MTITRPASDKQQSFIARLLSEKDTTGTCFEGHTVAPASLTSKQASDAITMLLALPRKANATTVTVISVPEGMHVFGGQVFKVQQAKNGSGHHYAKALTEDAEGHWHFEYVAGAIRNLSTATVMSAEQASQFGALYGVCCNCGRTLTDEGSIHFGYGPVCAANNGWPYGKVEAPAPQHRTLDDIQHLNASRFD